MFTIKNTKGAVLGTQILDEDGVDWCERMCVESFTITFPNAGSTVKANVVFGMVKTDVTALTADWVTKNPATDQYEAVDNITFRSGQNVSFHENGVFVYDSPSPSGSCARLTPVSDGRIVKFRSQKPDRS